MDDLTLLRELRAERVADDRRARAAAWRALEARFDVALAGAEPADPGAAEAYAAAAWRSHPRRSRRRGLLALAGALAAACGVAAVLLLGSSSTAPPAAAAVLRQTATVAATADDKAELPGPGQFLYTKTKVIELEGWVEGGPTNYGLPQKRPGAFNALVPTSREYWLAPDGASRSRQVMGNPRFLEAGERTRWKREGSPLPQPFDPRSQREAGARQLPGTTVLEARRGVYDVEIPKLKNFGRGGNLGFPDLNGLPIRPEALRLAIERNHAPGLGLPSKGSGKPLDTEETIEGLFGILTNPNATPALRAAAFNALAELPGIELRTGVTDLAGRSGDAITYTDQKYDLRNEYIFDPDTSRVLADRGVLVDPGKIGWTKNLPAGQVLRETAYLRTAVVDSTRERGGAQR